MKTVAIVLAGGKGSRMKSDLPKQYLPLLGKPVLYYALKAFEESVVDEIVLVTGDAQIDGMREVDYVQNTIILPNHLQKITMFADGGKERYNSVMNGLDVIANNGGADYVLIHDGARAMVTPEIIAACLADAKQYRASVAGVPVKDTIKIADANGFVSATPDRNLVWQVQTPQSFDYTLVYDAYQKMIADVNRGAITDDAMVVENYSEVPVRFTFAGYENIKITTPEDMEIAERFLQRK